MTIRLDVSQETVVVLCSSCGPVALIAKPDRAAGWSAGATHESACSGTRQAAMALTMLQRRQR